MPDNFPQLPPLVTLALVYLLSIAVMVRRALDISKDPWMKPKWYEVIGLTIIGLCPVINTIAAAVLLRNYEVGKI